MRSFTSDLWDIAKNMYDSNVKALLLIGNPGIGKSWFLNYCLFQASKIENIRVVFEQIKEGVYHIFYPDGSVNTFTGRPNDRIFSESGNRDIYLFDPYENDIEPYPSQIAFTIVASSPDTKHYKGFLKECKPKVLYLPVWEQEEIENLCDLLDLPNREMILDLYHKYGGILRYIFSEEDSYLHRQLIDAVNCVSEESLSCLENPERQITVSHKILHYVIDENFQPTKVKFASEYIAKKVFDHLENSEDNQIIRVMTLLKKSPWGSTLRGNIFEKYAHELIPSGCKFEVQSLEDNKTSELDIPILQRRTFDSLEDIETLEDNTFYEPNRQNFPAIDSLAYFDKQLYLFQATVGKKHPINKWGAYDIRGMMKKWKMKKDQIRNMKFYFVVPDDIFPMFKKQPFSPDDGPPDATQFKMKVLVTKTVITV